MNVIVGVVISLLAMDRAPMAPGDHLRIVNSGGLSRSYLLHVPSSYAPNKAAPVVMVLHPFATNALLMVGISGMNETADRAGFIAVYPNGNGKSQAFLAWNVGGMADKSVDDVGFIDKVLDDLAKIIEIDTKRVFATGMSNGAMMCYRLAAERSDRFAAIAPVAGTMTDEYERIAHPVAVLHFHGTKDRLIPFTGPTPRTPKEITFKSVAHTIQFWAKQNGCPTAAEMAEIARTLNDGLQIKRMSYGPGRDGAEVVLYVIEGGGHTWPGRRMPGSFLGASPLDLSASDLIWEFFARHPKK
jgi:polyhydroxybutyrate depolymerase